MKELSARLVDALVGVGAEEVPLRLQQVCRQSGRAIAIVEGERRRESRRRHAILNRFDDRAPPGSLVIVQCLAEKIVEKQLSQLRILVVRFLDLHEAAAAAEAPCA